MEISGEDYRKFEGPHIVEGIQVKTDEVIIRFTDQEDPFVYPLIGIMGTITGKLQEIELGDHISVLILPSGVAITKRL